jgi:NADPH:quinone reductase-like Zn-dependent oxidoreductase
MKAVRIHKFGSTVEVLQYDDVPIPEPVADELLIRIGAASLNRADLALRKGAYRIDPGELPVTPGREFAGTVAKLGGGIQDFKVGERVVACTRRSLRLPAVRKSAKGCASSELTRRSTTPGKISSRK